MGNELRIDSTNSHATREAFSNAYDKIRGKEEASLMENFSPSVLGLQIAFPLVTNAFSKEFKSVKFDPSLSGKVLYQNKYRMTRVNELGNALKKVKTSDAFLQADIISIQDKIKTMQSNGMLSKDMLKSLNKEYFQLLDKTTTWKKSFIEKGLIKAAKVSPGVGGELLKAFKANKWIGIIMETCQEIEPVTTAFSNSTESGMKQLAKSTGRVAAGFTGFIAGTAIGGKIGAIIGSVIPGAGTVIGGVIGSAIGFAVGGVCSQLARKGYNALVPDEHTVKKDNDINHILNDNDKSEETKNLLSTEIINCENYLRNAATLAQQAQAEGDNETYASTVKNVEEVNAVYETLVEVYQRKFGKIANNSAAVPQTPGTSEQIPANAPTSYATNPMANPFMMQQNQNMFNSSPQTDWSAMLSADAQKNLFGTAA